MGKQWRWRERNEVLKDGRRGRKSVRMGILRGLSGAKNHATGIIGRKEQLISRLHESADTHRKALAGRERVLRSNHLDIHSRCLRLSSTLPLSSALTSSCCIGATPLSNDLR